MDHDWVRRGFSYCLLAFVALGAPCAPATGDDDADDGVVQVTDQGPAQREEPTSQPQSEAGVAGKLERRPTTPVIAEPAHLPAPERLPEVVIDPARFKGAEAGKTTRDGLKAAWGAPAAQKKNEAGEQWHYKLEPFESVVATLRGDTVDTIIITLARPVPTRDMVEQLGMTEVAPVEIRDEQGKPLGQAFPERGVVLSYSGEGDKPETAQVLLAPIDPQAFVLRANDQRRRKHAAALADLNYAIELAPENAAARFMRAELLTELGRYPQALRDAEEAAHLDEANAEYHIALANVYAKVGQEDAALTEARQAIKRSAEGSAMRAFAHYTVAEALLVAQEPDYKLAVESLQKAISIADPIVAADDADAWDLALQVLLRAHLALARDIAWGNWKNKSATVTRWLAQGQEIAQEIVERDAAFGDESFLVAKEALAAYAGLDGKLDPTEWTEMALRSGRELIRQSDDPLTRARWQWELGTALCDSAQIFQARRLYRPAIEHAELAASYLERAGDERMRQPGQGYMVGRLYFRVGSIYAIQHRDHAAAIPWFEKAVPLLEEPAPPAARTDTGGQGETFVSMGVSYWETKRSHEAVRLTMEGLALMDRAVDEGLIERSALLVPYGNLARMHRQLGDREQAERFAELARRLETGTKRR